MKRFIACLWIVTTLSLVLPCAADGPDYRVPEQMSLPWACGDGYYVTWDPAGHWAEGKATGIAFDFSLPEGTPLYAPVSGMSYFLHDERPFETNFGHYVEIVDLSGNWLIRLAHLRDAQSGKRLVRVGEMIGYSGVSGAYAAHLHLELLVRDGARWIAPDLAQLSRFLGLDLVDFAPGALITHDGCAPSIAMGGQVEPSGGEISLGQMAELMVPLRNDGREAVTLNTVQVMLYSPAGIAWVANAEGEWPIAPASGTTIPVAVQAPLAGDWYVGRVVYRAEALSGGMPAKGKIEVTAPSIQVEELAVRTPVLYTGDILDLVIRIRNTGVDPLAFDDLVVQGTQPDGVVWQATVGDRVSLPVGREVELALHNTAVLQTVGVWRIERLGYRREGQVYFFQQLDQMFYLFGPQLEAEKIETFSVGDSWHIFLTLRNVGTHTAYPDAIEVWGWKPDGEEPFSANTTMLRPLAEGEAALIRLRVPLGKVNGTWRLVEAGSWQKKQYYRVRLPQQAASAAID